jgi:hypothetical protein
MLENVIELDSVKVLLLCKSVALKKGIVKQTDSHISQNAVKILQHKSIIN